MSIALTIEPGDLSGMSAFYDAFLDGRTEIGVRRGAEARTIPVISVAHLLVTKLTRRGDKAKDLVDVAELLAAARDAGRALDLPLVRKLVQDQPHALALLAEIESATKEGGS